uniref:Uncharacterized protein n=1 Tax=Oryza punctata TaxID=4537 RepID=A0A0E0KAI2_ORYPU
MCPYVSALSSSLLSFFSDIDKGTTVVPRGESFPCAATATLATGGRNMDLLILFASNITPSPPQTSPTSLIPSLSSLLSHGGQHT